MMVFSRFDVTPERRQQAVKKAARAVALAPEAFETRFAQAYAFSFADESPAMRAEAARIFRLLLQEKPADRNTLINLGTTLRELEQYDEAAALFVRAGDPSSEGWNYYVAGRFEEAARVADRMLARERTVGAILLKAQTERVRGNLDAAQAAVDLFTPEELLTEQPMAQASGVAQVRGEYDRVIQLLNAYPQEFLDVSGFNGPKRLLIGTAHERAGRVAAARQEWQTALRQLDERLAGKSTEAGLIGIRAMLLACLGEKEEAERALRLAQELTVASPNRFPIFIAQLRLGHKEEVLAALEKAFGERKRGWLSLYLSVRWNREFEVLRGDPRFEKLMRDNLPDGVKPLDEPRTEGRKQKTDEGGRK
jgi:tetratricopeptide (TPR) repeat protein